MNEKERTLTVHAACSLSKVIIGYCERILTDISLECKAERPDLDRVQEEMRLMHYAGAALEKMYRALMQEVPDTKNQILTNSHSDKSVGPSTVPSSISHS